MNAGVARLFAAVTVLIAVAAACCPRIPQSQDYHHFADGRSLAGIPNAGDVLSNLAFLLVFAADRLRRGRPVGRSGTSRRVLLAGVLLTAFGSAWYHLSPDDDRLVFDRLGMVVAFAGTVGVVLDDRIGKGAGWRLLPWLVLLGIASVLHWRWSEAQGAGDLRFYGAMQALPIVFVAVALAVGKGRGSSPRPLLFAFAFYALAKLCELGDRFVFERVVLVSGHTLKHLMAAAACGALLAFGSARGASPGPAK